MATTFISINTGQRLGAQLRSAIDSLQAAKQALAKLKATMDSQVNATDYTMVESNFGLQTGQGQTCYNLVAGTNTELAAGTNTGELLAWCG